MNTLKVAGLMVFGVLMAQPALAVDLVGTAGRVIGVEVNGDSSDYYTSARGHLFIDEGDDIVRRYNWGGQACSGKYVTDMQLAFLNEALHRRAARVIPYYQPAGGNNRCLVGIGIAPSKAFLPDIERP